MRSAWPPTAIPYLGSRRPVPFFFSSRRRHTRSLRDWSSDVCSSDLRDILTGVICDCDIEMAIMVEIGNGDAKWVEAIKRRMRGQPKCPVAISGMKVNFE